MDEPAISIVHSRVHNLKSVSCVLPHNKFYCLTGLSGSGKSSFAFDTIFVEGQRRYIESLSQQAKRLFSSLPKPDADSITGLTPTIAIEQKSISHNPRSTVGTLTEIYDYLRVLFARFATPYCPISLEPIIHQTKDEVLSYAYEKFKGEKIIILANWVEGKKGSLEDDLDSIQKQGFSRVRLDGKISTIEEIISINLGEPHDLDIVIDRIQVHEENRDRMFESGSIALEIGRGYSHENGMMTIFNLNSEEETLFSTHAFSKSSGQSYPPLAPNDFSFNSPIGMCPGCQGLGQKQVYILEKIIDKTKSIREDCCIIASSYKTVRYKNIYDNLASLYQFSVDTPFSELPETAQSVFLYGTKKKWTRMVFIHPQTGKTWHDTIQWRGVLHEAYQRYQEATSELFKQKQEEFMRISVCPDCNGSRLKPYPSAARFFGKKIEEIVSMTIQEAHNFFLQCTLTKDQKILAQELLDNITSRLHFLQKVGLNYITLDRSSPTLSGGEAQRVRLAAHIGSGLTGITYVLDEPSIGLHPYDNKKLIESLIQLRDKGNTVIVVEHDEETMKAADTLIEFGPNSGENGGEILFFGNIEDLKQVPFSHTKEYLFQKKLEKRTRRPITKETKYLSLVGATLNNLQNVTLSLPLGLFIGVTGLSGSGKSSLFLETLFPAVSNELHNSLLRAGPYQSICGIEAITKIIQIDQSPIGRTPRSNPATYSKVFDEIRTLFALLPESKIRGWTAGRFSFNVKEGSCSECGGMGMIRVDMGFLEESWVECPICGGQRFDEETLSVQFRGKNIQEVLDMTVGEASKLFSSIPKIKKKLELLSDVGLDYIRLGQSSTTLSGGEAQRLKLAKELSRPDSGSTLYILDEPTTGLHFRDIEQLLSVLQRLVDQGNSVVVIEHNMDLIAQCDWTIDLGPESGNQGGEIIFEGSVEELAQQKSPTGIALKEHLFFRNLNEEEREKHISHIKQASNPPPSTFIEIEGAAQHNLRSISVQIPRNGITTIIGPSGSGKSSLAFDTIYAEGQRRYVESLSPYVRQFVLQMPKPKVESIQGICPTVAIEQRQHAGNPRSTVGTITEVYDYLRILWARLGVAYSPITGKKIEALSKESIAHTILSFDPDTRVEIFAPLTIEKGQFKKTFGDLIQNGFTKIRIGDELYSLDDLEAIPQANEKKKREIELIIDRFKPTFSIKKQLLDSLQLAATMGKKKIGLRIGADEKRVIYNLQFTIEGSDESYPEITPQTFAFNTKNGMCQECKGLGYQLGFDIEELPLTKESTLSDLFHFFIHDYNDLHFIEKALQQLGIDLKAKIEELSAEQKKVLFYGSDQHISEEKAAVFAYCRWIGLNQALEIFVKNSTEEEIASLFNCSSEQLIKKHTCQSCNGSRLNPLARNVLLDGISITAFTEMAIEDSLIWIEKYKKTNKNLSKAFVRVIDDIIARLRLLNDIGIGYISLSRSATTLSGGEAQRVRLVSQIGAALTGIIYVLDEPTIGLHPLDAKKLIQSLHRLRKLNNSVLLVEHDPEIMKISDKIIELGPKSGTDGGSIVFEGSYADLMQAETCTAIAIREKNAQRHDQGKRREKKSISILKATTNNLQISDLQIPTNSIVSISGVSGSGKSTLLFDVLQRGFKAYNSRISDIHEQNCVVIGFDQFQQLISIDQKPFSHNSRSDLATYTDLLTPIRYFFSTLPEAQKLGLEPKHFSTYHKKGACTDCFGLGYKKISMHFMPPVQIECPGCHGKRLNPISLSVQYKGYSIGDILQLSLFKVATLFDAHPKITKIVNALIQLDLGYLMPGQEIATLSSGEAQRVKIAREISKIGNNPTLFLMDEPTTGMHLSEVTSLLSTLDRLVSTKKCSIIAIEHNISFISNSDYIIEIGPGAGIKGGKVIAKGSPKEIAENKNSLIAPHLISLD